MAEVTGDDEPAVYGAAPSGGTCPCGDGDMGDGHSSNVDWTDGVGEFESHWFLYSVV